jgi:hypothetical protein
MSQLPVILQQLLKPEFHQPLATWHNSASRDELKGLRVILSICNSKGQRRFKSKVSPPRSDEPTLEEVDVKRHKRRFESAYESQFTAPREMAKKPSVFKYSSLHELPCSAILTNDALKYLQSWLGLKDDESYQEAVLVCLRSMAAMLSLSRQAMSENKQQFAWKKPSRRLRAFNPTLALRQLRSKTSTMRPVMKPQAANKVNLSMEVKGITKEDIDKRKRVLMRGSGKITSGLGIPMNPLSSYQDTYVTHFTRYHQPKPRDFYTSISVGHLIRNIRSAK